jgi:hypothetical protein
MVEYRYIVAGGKVQEKLDEFSSQGWTVHSIYPRKGHDRFGTQDVTVILFERPVPQTYELPDVEYDRV